MKTRIELADNMMDIVTKMCELNPGAITAIMEMYTRGEKIDPQSFAGGLGAILTLDSLGIYGSEIYVLWSDQCKRDTRMMLALLRAHQLGFIGESRIKEITSDHLRSNMLTDCELKTLDEKVCAELVDFKKENEK